MLQRNFKADKLNQKWVTDVTEFALLGKKLYIFPILDLFNGEIISYNLSERPTFHQTTDMLKKEFEKLNIYLKLVQNIIMLSIIGGQSVYNFLWLYFNTILEHSQ